MAELIRLETKNGHGMRAWLAKPHQGQGKFPAVLVIHEALGLVENIEPIVDRFAQNGYVALAPDLFDKPEPKPLCISKAMLTMMTGHGDAIHDLDNALSHLASLEAVDSQRLAACGFCMGGGFALLMALEGVSGLAFSHRLKASAPYYGRAPVFFRNAEKSCPVVAGYGRKDLLFGDVGDKLTELLSRNGIPHDIKTYPDAGHSYMTYELPGLLYRLGKAGPLRVAYRPDDAEDSWQRMLKFFAEHV